MNYCLVTFISGNHAILVRNLLRSKGIEAEVISTPCSIAKEGCSYCIKVQEPFVGSIINQAYESKVPVRSVYDLSMINGKKKYKKREMG